jgi:hypothetical protein
MPRENRALQQQVASAIEELESLREPLTSDMSIEALERFETSWKEVLRELLRAPLTGDEARTVAAFQRDVGLLPKYKSYAIKASSPLGYSVFFQEPGKGFSFQQHRHHKIEIFHVLEAAPESFALLCSLAEWNADYEPEAFARWLEGAENPVYERWRIPLVAGDVICLEKTGIVHSVIGCTLEEFATVSTDMVDRLHDQNSGAPVPRAYRREKVLQLLQETPSPAESRQIAGRKRLPLQRQGFPGGEIVTLGEVQDLGASRIRLESGRRSPLLRSGDRAVVLFASRGDADLLLGTAAELAHGEPPSLKLPRGCAALLPPGMSYKVAALGEEAEISQHSILPSVALVEEARR